MRKLILMGGDLASGKSTFANIIGEELNVMVINKDNLKEIIGDTIIVKDRAENKKLSVISFDIMCYLLEKNMDSTIILESNFKPYEMEKLAAITKEYDYQVMSIVFKGDNEVLHERFLRRLLDNRHYVHKSQDFTKLEDFVACLEELRSTEYIGKVYHVDSTDFTYQADPVLLNTINDFVKE